MLYIFLANAVVRVVFAPYNGMWRLVNMDDAKAKRLAAAFYFSFFVVGVSSMLLHIAGEANYTVELIYYLSLINSAVKAFCVVLVVKRFFWEEDAVCELTEEGADDEDFVDAKTRTAFRVIFSLPFWRRRLSAFPYSAIRGFPNLLSTVFCFRCWSSACLSFSESRYSSC